MIIDKLEKDYNEFYEVACTIFKEVESSYIEYLIDKDNNTNIRLIINSLKQYDIANFIFSIKIEYIFDFSTVDMPIDCINNDYRKVEFEYQTDFLHTDRNKILDDFKKIVPAWTDIKTAENRDLALKKLDILVRSYKMNEDFL